MRPSSFFPEATNAIAGSSSEMAILSSSIRDKSHDFLFNNSWPEHRDENWMPLMFYLMLVRSNLHYNSEHLAKVSGALKVTYIL